MLSIWEELNKLDDNISYNFIEDNKQSLLEMAVIRGIDTIIDDIDFSFFFSRNITNHTIRIKIYWDPTKIGNGEYDGYIELHGNYKYISSPKAHYKPKAWEIKGLQYFCRKYKILFSAVWEEKLPEKALQQYFKGEIKFVELMTKFVNISEEEFYWVNHCRTPRELENCVRDHHIFNIND